MHSGFGRRFGKLPRVGVLLDFGDAAADASCGMLESAFKG